MSRDEIKRSSWPIWLWYQIGGRAQLQYGHHHQNVALSANIRRSIRRERSRLELQSSGDRVHESKVAVGEQRAFGKDVVGENEIRLLRYPCRF